MRPAAQAGIEAALGAAVSTGTGEYFMRLVIAKVAVDAMAAASAQEAAEAAIELVGRRLGGKGGIITIDRAGRAGAHINTRCPGGPARPDRLNSQTCPTPATPVN